MPNPRRRVLVALSCLFDEGGEPIHYPRFPSSLSTGVLLSDMPAPSRPSPKVSQIPAETAILAPDSPVGRNATGEAEARGANGENPGFRSNALQIYESMRQRIAIRHYPPGAWLKEQEIAAEFGVSRTPVRQALQQLETEGLVEIKNGVGVRVTEVDDAALDQIYLLRLELVALIGVSHSYDATRLPPYFRDATPILALPVPGDMPAAIAETLPK